MLRRASRTELSAEVLPKFVFSFLDDLNDEEKDRYMSEQASAPAPAPAVSAEEIQREWPQLTLKVAQLEAAREGLQQENKALRDLLERAIEHRQKSHGELVLLLTGLVSKLPMNDVGAIVARLVEHNSNVSQYLAALIKGTSEAEAFRPTVLKNLEQTRRDLLAALKPVIEELQRLEAPFEPALLKSLAADPEFFFSPAMIRANRCFVKGCVSRERIVREFGQEALVFFNDLTTDPKRNAHPKPEEIVLGFRPDFEALLQANPGLLPGKRESLLALYHGVQCSRAQTEQARAQKNAFQRFSFIIELLHFYEHQETEAPDVLFAQRLPNLIEQLILGGSATGLDEKLIVQAEGLLAPIINPEHRHAVINNIGKGGTAGQALKFVLRFREEKMLEEEADQLITDFIRHLTPSQTTPAPGPVVALLRLVPEPMQRRIIKALWRTDRLPHDQAENLGKALAAELGLTGVVEEVKVQASLPPETERQMAWLRVQDMVQRRSDPVSIAEAIRARLNSKYNADEIRQSWITLTEADPMTLIRIICHLPYLPDGKTDPIARTVLETYVTRLLHEKYAATYHKVLNSLRNMFRAKPDSPTLVTFVALVKWASPEAAARVSADIGMPVAA